MHTTIVRVHVKDKEEAARRVREGFLPKLRGLPGFLGYYVIDGEGDTAASIITFETREEAEAAREPVMDYAREARLDELTEGEPELIATGDTVIAEWLEEHEERRAA
jgi:hypothetical protein